MPVRDLLSAASTQGGGPADPYFYDVSLLLNGDGTNGAQNNTFLDSSTNNFTITRNGNTTQGSFSPYGTLWSNYFNSGTTDYLTTSGSALPSGTGDFTIQGWIFLSDTTANATKVITSGSATNSLGFRVGQSYHGNINGLGLTRYNAADNEYCSYTFSANTWYHIAVVRKSSVIYFYINGVQQTTQGSGLGSYSLASAGTTYIAGDTNGDEKYNGYISNLQVTNNAVYSSNFTPSTTPLTAVSGTSLLTCQSNRFIDNSSNAFALTVNGTPSVQRFSPFNPTAPYSTSVIGGSGYFDGSSYLTMASNSAFSPGTGDFTVECWVNFNPSVTPEVAFFTTTNNPSSANGQLWFGYSGGQLRISRHGSGAYIVGYTWSPGINNWHYVTATRASGTTYLFVDGVLVTTSTLQNGISFSEAGAMIGLLTGNSPPYMQGYLTDVRYTVGTALYTSTFTPPTAPLTASGSTTFLASFQNAGIPDLAMQNDLQTVGSAQVSTSVKKYGTGSLYFDGSSNIVSAPSTQFAWGTGDFTVECWLYNTVSFVSGGTNITGTMASGGALFFGNTTYGIAWNAFGVGNVVTYSTQLSLNTWYHIAYSRNSGTGRLFVNGSLVGSASDSNNYTATTFNSGGVSSQYFTGYIDDLRITNGLARYTANFTPPTSALPTY